MACHHDKINSALDRWHESHWYLHQVENNYHDADTLRYSMNAFIRSTREIPDMITMALQNQKGFPAWHRPIKKSLEKDDELFKKIIKHRNFIVHKSILVPNSKAHIAAIRGFTVKMAFQFYVDPFEHSDVAIERFCASVSDNPVLFQMLMPDEVQLLAVIREWHLDEIDSEIIVAFRNAWIRVGMYLSDVMEFLGGERFPDGLPPCFKDIRCFTYKKYPDIDLDPLYSIANQEC